VSQKTGPSIASANGEHVTLIPFELLIEIKTVRSLLERVPAPVEPTAASRE